MLLKKTSLKIKEECVLAWAQECCARTDAHENANPRNRDVSLVGGGLGFGGVDFDATLEMSAVLDADARA